MIYSYKRVSTVEQTTARQSDAINQYCKENNIVVDRNFEDKASGKNFDRVEYKKMRELAKEGDVIIVKELDRFGRDWELIKKEWQYFMDNGVRIIVVDMPLISSDPSKSMELDKKLIASLVFEVLCYTAQKEREKISKRVKEGMASAKARGVKLGRECKYTDEMIEQMRYAWENDYLKIREICDKFGISKPRLQVIRREQGWTSRRAPNKVKVIE